VSDFSKTLRFLILGDDGQAGQSLIQYLESRDIPYLSLSSLEVTNPTKLSDVAKLADQFFYIVNVLFEEPSEGVAANTDNWLALAIEVATLAKKLDKPLLYLSSSLVFSGKSVRAYVETDPTDSSSPLGLIYSDIEQQTVAIWPKTIVVRAGWLFSEQAGNFLTRLVGAAISSESLNVSGNLKGCPTYSLTLARVLVAITEQVDCGAEPSLWGIYHYADSDACTMHTFAKTVITVVKSMSEVRVENLIEGSTPTMIDAVTTTENYELSCKKILSSFGIKQRPWRRSIHDVLKEKFASTE